MTDKPNYSLKDLLNEKTEKEKGCGIRLPNFREQKIICGMIHKNNNIGKILCPVCRAEISALKKGIQACEEILSQQGKQIEIEPKGTTVDFFHSKPADTKTHNNLNNTSTNLNLNKGCGKWFMRYDGFSNIEDYCGEDYLCDDCKKAVKK